MDRGNEDKRFIEQLLCGLKVGVVHEDIRKVIRFGKRIDEAEAVRGPRVDPYLFVWVLEV